MKATNDNFVKSLKLLKFKSSIPYKDEFKVLVRVNIDNLKEFSKDKFSSVNMLDKTKIEIINKIKIGERIRDLIFKKNNLYMFLEDTASIGKLKIN